MNVLDTNGFLLNAVGGGINAGVARFAERMEEIGAEKLEGKQSEMWRDYARLLAITIDRLTDSVAAKDAVILERDQAIAQRDAIIAEQTKEIAAAVTRINDFRERSQDHEAYASELLSQLTKTSDLLNRQSATSFALNEVHKGLVAELLQLNDPSVNEKLDPVAQQGLLKQRWSAYMAQAGLQPQPGRRPRIGG